MVTTACNGGSMSERNIQYEKFSDIPDTVWNKLSEKSIYFGHQSVGFNIIDGIDQIIKEENTIPIKTQIGKSSTDFKPGVFVHSEIGQNTKPKSKLNEFIQIVNESGKKNADIMFFKFCYIDFNSETDVTSLFKDYKKSFDQLKRNNPDTIFMHVTVPLTTIRHSGGFKGLIKRLMGMPPKGIEENIKRCEFSEMIRETYSGKAPIFDLALVESTFPDGSRSHFKSNGKTFYSLVPEYTNDGGHLNDIGKRVAAEHLLVMLANFV